MDASTGPGAPLNLCLSEDGLYAAHVSGKGLVVHSNVFSDNKEKMRSPLGGDSLSANDSRISVWQLIPLEIFAEIESIEPGTIAVDFGADENEVLVFHAWNTKLSVHSLETGRSSVIKAPKFAHHFGYGYRTKTRHLAILLKPETSDLLTVHEPRSYELVNKTVLPTIDAQGLKWSPDGKWIAIWDIASAGTKVLVFTADGQLFRTYSGPSGVDDSFDLGVKQIEWSPAPPQGISEILAVGKVNGNIDLLRTRTVILFRNNTLPCLPNRPTMSQYLARAIYQRLRDAEYAETSCSSALSMSPESAGPPRGVLTMTFSSDGRLLATIDTARQNVVWIWSLEGTPRLASALVHEQPVRQIVWHPSTPKLLINTITNTLPVIRWWSPQSHPLIARVPVQRTESGKYDVRWVAGSSTDSPFWFSSPEEHVIGYLSSYNGGVEFEVLNSVSSKTAEGLART
ncbi:hypothetical protein N7491_004464 [Penicillium cf. griseofulvum]|nr:hypothetical protein N7491_004464 [Penicillium cf. griseofulvum]